MTDMTSRKKIYLQLLLVFSQREILSRYKASILGILWIAIYPIAVSLILNYVFNSIFSLPNGDIPYFLFVFSSLIVWNFFNQGIILSMESLIWNRELVTKAAFPKSTLPLSYIFSKIPDFFVSYVILLCFYFAHGFSFGLHIFYPIVIMIPLLLFSSGFAFIVSMTNAIFRDAGRLIELALLVLFYASPIVYSYIAVPQHYSYLLYINPIAITIMGIQTSLFHYTFRIDLLALNFFWGGTLLFLGYMLFNKYEKKIADLI